MVWGYTDDAGTWQYGNATTTNAYGYYQFIGVRETTKGTIEADVTSLVAYIIRESLTFTPGTNTVDILPGLVSFAVSDKSGYEFNEVLVHAYGDLGECRTQLGGESGTVLAFTPAVTYAVVYFTKDGGNWDEGVEWAGSTPVTTDVPTGSIVVDESKASWTYVGAPYWASGPPGAQTKHVMEQWLAPMRARILGHEDSPAGTGKSWPNELVGTTAARRVVKLTIPRTATPGYTYVIRALRSDLISAHGGISMLNPTTTFELCTLKASKTSISRGAAVRLSGVVPTQGHWGSQPGRRNTVILYARTKSPSGQPKTWDATKSGWKKVARFKSNKLGAYARRVTPAATTWYVVRYDEDNWYYGGYTAVVRVRVR
jgi:hypothetical protein